MIPYRNIEFLDASLLGGMGHAHFIVYRDDKTRPVYLLEFMETGWRLTKFDFPNRGLTARYLATGEVVTHYSGKADVLARLPKGWTWDEFLVAMAMFEQGKEVGQNI